MENTLTPPERPFGRINWIGLKSLYWREVWRFMKVWNQTITSPMVTALLFLAIFSLALGGNRNVEGISYDVFMAPGLIMMSIVQNAFANTSSSLMLSKLQGVIIDLLMPPLAPGEVVVALVAGAITRGVVVGISVSFAVWVFVPFEIHHPFLALFYFVSASAMLALLGVIAGVWSQGFEQMAAINNYVITPLAFLSGTFYPIRNLPEGWYKAAHFDPLFYMIDGVRYAFTGYYDSPVWIGMVVLSVMNVLLFITAYVMFAKGWRLKG